MSGDSPAAAKKNRRVLLPEELAAEREAARKVREYVNELSRSLGRPAGYHVRTFGCQQNEADSEVLSGIASSMGYVETEDLSKCELMIVNTCAVREHAEKRALSITGQFKHLKQNNPALKIVMCGCMVSQAHRSDEIKRRYPYVDVLFGTDSIYKLPSLLLARLNGGKRSFTPLSGEDRIAEGLPVKRRQTFSAYLPVMSGCNNFCTYCVVPYVRGRERSRLPGDVLREAEGLIRNGCREITLLGQNVNSYGKDLGGETDFSALLRSIDAIEGDFRVRFMTSHPKDASEKLLAAMAECRHVSPHLHLPFQSGSDAVLKRMNRSYTRERYLDLVASARETVPGLALSSDVIVGFPGESEADFEDTLSLLSSVRFDSVFSFLFSPRVGTPAARMEDQVDPSVSSARLDRLMALQNDISLSINQACVGTVREVLVSSAGKPGENVFTGRDPQNKLVHFSSPAPAEERIGRFVKVKIERAEPYALIGTEA